MASEHVTLQGTDEFQIVSGREPLTAVQRKLFNLLLWHALNSGIETDPFEIGLEELVLRLGVTGRTRQWLLLNAEKLASGRLRWALKPADGVEDNGFCPLLGQCWVAGDRFAFSLPERLKTFVTRRKLFRKLDLKISDFFRHPFSEGLYRMLQRYADEGTTGWRSLEKFRMSLGIDEDTGLSTVSGMRDKVAAPALEEINLFSELTAEAAFRRDGEPPENEIRFHIRRKDEDRPDACLMLPGFGDDTDELSPESALEQRFEAYKAGQVCDISSGMADGEREDILQAFLQSIQGNSVLMRKYEKNGLDSLAVKLAYEVYLEKMLLNERQRDVEWFKLMKNE